MKGSLSIIIPALNEEENIELLLLQIRALRPQPTEVVVAVGDSTDDTAKVAEKYGAKVVRGKRGRSRQMNAGVHALATHPTNVLFLHADTMPFPDILNVIDETMRDAKAIVGGFVSLITTEKQMVPTHIIVMMNKRSSQLVPVMSPNPTVVNTVLQK